MRILFWVLMLAFAVENVSIVYNVLRYFVLNTPVNGQNLPADQSLRIVRFPPVAIVLVPVLIVLSRFKSLFPENISRQKNQVIYFSLLAGMGFSLALMVKIFLRYLAANTP